MINSPSILLEATLPPPLHKLSPKNKNILGATWWTKVRKSAEIESLGCCHACGTHKSQAWYRKTLEGHEIYDVDWINKTVTLDQIVVLCRSCHNYIHAGRLLKQYRDKVVSRNFVENVLRWGIETVLPMSDTPLKPQIMQAIHYLMLCKGYSREDAISISIKKGLVTPYLGSFEPYGKWELIVDNKKFGIDKTDRWYYNYDKR